MEDFDPYGQEATDLLERHRLQGVHVERIKRARAEAERRQRAADTMRASLRNLAQTFYDRGRDDDDTTEEMRYLSALLQEHDLSAAQRADVWAYVAQLDAALGW